MSNVLFDEPGPQTVVRHRLYTVLASIALLLVAAYVIWRLYEEGQFAYELWEPLVTPAYMQALLEGMLVTLQMAFSAVLLALIFGVLFGIGKLSDHGFVRWPCWAVVEFFRAVPLLILIIFVFYLWFLKAGGPGEYWSVVIGLTLYNGAVLAEVFRAGILAVPRGQAEAAYAIGMRKSQVMTLVLLPQAVKIMLPAIISQMVVALKDTSLGYVTTALVLPTVAESIYLQFNNQIPTMIVVAAMYITVNLILTWIATWAQKRYVGEKKPLEVSNVAADASAAV
jgi:glutamate transport system permease protein